ncbi:MAG: hypothetical protein AAGA96_13920, partial [Verrucomicrobiota bacterium]
MSAKRETPPGGSGGIIPPAGGWGGSPVAATAEGAVPADDPGVYGGPRRYVLRRPLSPSSDNASVR